MIAKVAIVGRVNVGKSTLFNRMIGRRIAIFEDKPGVTRDRLEGTCEWSGVEFRVTDTGGIISEPTGEIELAVQSQVRIAAKNSDIIIFLMDGKSGLHHEDHLVAQLLRKTKKKIFIVINKTDSNAGKENMSEFYELGFPDIYAISAEHGENLGDLLDDIIEYIKDSDFASVYVDEKSEYKVALVGRRNVGKSTLINCFSGTERVIVTSIPGTTRDPVDIQIKLDDTLFTFIDTAGFFKKSKIKEDTDFYSYRRACDSILRSDFVLLLMDSNETATREDKQIASFIEKNRKPLIVVLNKIDLLDVKDTRSKGKKYIQQEVPFISYAPVVTISALMGKNIDDLYKEIDLLVQRFSIYIPHREIFAFLREMFVIQPPPLSHGKAVRLKFSFLTSYSPFSLILGMNHDPPALRKSYVSFLKNELRKTYDLEGIPIVVKQTRSK
ncbi:ribosome biogenesis GTPase Der [bacterium]|nr:ribosome biogenesis GTPase Der [bacterium]